MHYYLTGRHQWHASNEHTHTRQTRARGQALRCDIGGSRELGDRFGPTPRLGTELRTWYRVDEPGE